jgi:hypothetical protein
MMPMGPRGRTPPAVQPIAGGRRPEEAPGRTGPAPKPMGPMGPAGPQVSPPMVAGGPPGSLVPGVPRQYAKGGKIKGYAKGGKVSSASKRADGIAMKGKTKGKFV